MFMLKTLSRFILGDDTQKELFKLPTGELWQTELKKKVLNRTRVYPNASVTLQRLDQPFEFALVVEEAGEENGKSTECPIFANMDFERHYGDDGEAIFSWAGEGVKYRYEFVADPSTTPSTIEMFHVIVAQCLYSTMQRRPHTEATDDELQQLLVVSRNDQPLLTSGELFKSELALFYVFDASTGVFLPKSEQSVNAIISIDDKGKVFYLSVVTVDGTELHRQVVDPDATLHTDRPNNSFIWCHFNDAGYTWTFSLRFTDSVGLMGMSNAMGMTIYEILNNSKVSEEDSKYLMSAFTADVEMVDASSEESGSDVSDVESEASGLDEERYEMQKSESANQQLVVGFKNDRSFVTRGNTISVFKHTADDSIQLAANIDKVQNTKGRKFNPTKMMLHEEDKSMVLMDAADPSHLFKMDLEYGKVVEDWKVHPNETTSITAIIPDSKYAQMTSNQTLIGLNPNSIFRIDPRLPGTKRVDNEMKSYVVKNDFTCGTTTGNGELAVASAKGEIRLFDKLDKRAKTLLPGFGDAILGIDVTESGKYIIATCKTYLLLICTEIPGTDSLGFKKSMGAQKPIPKRLQLKPEHVAYMGTPISFTPARFSTGQSEERAIITSTGPYVITWNLRRVKQGAMYEYQIRKYQEDVVADNFRYGQDRNIVVTLPNHVTMISKQSLATPSASLFKSDIVQKY
ncbi:hypothetical protein PSACC_01535 [Paramicrosporidium saccamoebae]|uniref:Uncharacterized protein n=1 Tax=Paramicrosporidium saccamoebae TaxID=1246581 RepID=A0A2H9TLX4_9FUNG|nr:hypothetical protein PSACC_01535 [Paramicrosporidium saccamoebae]